MGNNNDNNSKHLKNDYFTLLRSTMSASYISNYYSKKNQLISLFKKDFNKVISNTRIMSHEEDQIGYIYWKNYILFYLKAEKEKGLKWADSLYTDIINQPFANSSYFLNDLFYNEFKIATCNKKIKELSSKEIKINKVNNDGISSYMDNKLNISNNFIGSFVSLFSDSMHPSDNPSLEYQKNKSKINEYLMIFKTHIFNKDHPINFIVSRFCYHFEQYIQNDITNEEIITQLQSFIVEMQVVLKLFYARTITLINFKDEKDEIVNLISSLIFNTGKLYECIYNYFQNKASRTIYKFKENIEQLKDLKPEYLGIKKQFCLNEIAEQYKKELIKERKITDINQSLQLKEKDHNLDENIKNAINCNSSTNELVVSSGSLKLAQITEKSFMKNTSLIREYYIDRPYYAVIELIHSLSMYKVPFQKIIVMATISSEITKCVNDFWADSERLLTKDILNIDADDLMNLFIFIVVTAQMPELVVHLMFVKYFTTPATKSTMMGYYFTTLEGSVDFLIKEEEFEKLYKTYQSNKEDKRNNE